MAEIRLIPTAPVNGSSESQQIATGSGTITSGRFKLGYKTDVTDWLAWNATATQVRDALRLLNEITATGINTATGGALPGTPVVANFGGHLANANVAQLTVAANELVGGTLAITTTAAGVNGSPRGMVKGTIVVAQDTGVAYINTGTPEAPVWKRFAAAAVAGALADLTGTTGTADGAVDDVGSSFAQATLNNNFKEHTVRLNAITAVLRGAGLIP